MGGFFSLRTKSDSTAGAEDTPLGVESAGSPAAHIRAEASQAVERDISAVTRKRGRPRGDAGNMPSDQAALQAKVNSAVIAQLDTLHSPKAWQALLCLPAHAALALTGNERWKLEKDEKEVLGETGSAAAQTLMITNPRALAFMMLGSALLTVYGPRAIAQLQEMADKRKGAKKDEQAKPTT